MRSFISDLSSLALSRTVYILSFIESLVRFSMSSDIDCYTECRIDSFLISKMGRERNELNQDSKTENESEGPFSRWLALVALTSSFCLLHSCWSLFTARFFSCGSDWTELLGTIARLTALAAQPDTTASRTLLPLSIKLLYLALTAHCLLSCRLVRWTRACGFSTLSAWSCDFWSLPLSAWINSTKRGKIP